MRRRLDAYADDGLLGPMVAFVSHTTGEALGLGIWNQIFTTAQARLAAARG